MRGHCFLLPTVQLTTSKKSPSPGASHPPSPALPRGEGGNGGGEDLLTLQQAAGDDLRLDLGGALENAEGAGVAQHAAHLIFEGEAVAAMDLQRIVGIAPGNARRQQLRHAGLEVAAPAGILL